MTNRKNQYAVFVMLVVFSTFVFSCSSSQTAAPIPGSPQAGIAAGSDQKTPDNTQSGPAGYPATLEAKRTQDANLQNSAATKTATVAELTQTAAEGNAEANSAFVEATRQVLDLTPTYTPTPVPTATQTPAPITDAELKQLENQWLVFKMDTYNFQFDYPAVYGTNKYQQCRPQEIPVDQSQGSQFTAVFDMGKRSELLIQPVEIMTMDEVVTNFFSNPNFTLSNQAKTTVGGQPAIKLEYQFGGPSNFGTMVVVQRDPYMYIFNIAAGDFCNVTEFPLTEQDAFQKMIQSFTFLK